VHSSRVVVATSDLEIALVAYKQMVDLYPKQLVERPDNQWINTG
jgi:hypothetical protein